MGKVIIDYDKFKEVLSDYLSKNLIDEIISSMNDNDVFIEDISTLREGKEKNKMKNMLRG